MTDIMERLQQMIDHHRGIIQKSRVYLHPGEPEPKGIKISTGPHGGRYYDTVSHSPKHAYDEIHRAMSSSHEWREYYGSQHGKPERIRRRHRNEFFGSDLYGQNIKPGKHQVSVADRHKQIDTIPSEDEEEIRRKWWKKRKKNLNKYDPDEKGEKIKKYEDVKTINDDYLALKRKNPTHFKTFTESPGRVDKVDKNLFLPKVRGKWKPRDKHRYKSLDYNFDEGPRNKAESDRKKFDETLWEQISSLKRYME